MKQMRANFLDGTDSTAQLVAGKLTSSSKSGKIE